jgi:5-methylcytosine-specific restriction endonuclease McrA
MRRWRRNNPKAVQAYRRQYRKEHNERMKEQDKKTYLRHRKKILSRKTLYFRSKWRSDPKFRKKCQLKCEHYRALRARATVATISPEDLHGRWREFSFRCAYCGRRAKLTQDHVRPLDRGGRHAIPNIIPACQPCNSSHGNRPWRSWFRAQPFYSKQREQRIEQALRKERSP